MDEFYIKLGVTVIASLCIFILMTRYQNRKLKEADEKFKTMMKCRGLSLEPLTEDELEDTEVTSSKPHKIDR